MKIGRSQDAVDLLLTEESAVTIRILSGSKELFK
jgi:hypothetical protein